MPLRVVGFLIFSAPPQGLFLEPLPKINKLQTSLVSDEAFLEGVWSRAAGKEGERKQSKAEVYRKQNLAEIRQVGFSWFIS